MKANLYLILSILMVLCIITNIIKGNEIGLIMGIIALLLNFGYYLASRKVR